jgi:hypothetical protein
MKLLNVENQPAPAIKKTMYHRCLRVNTVYRTVAGAGQVSKEGVGVAMASCQLNCAVERRSWKVEQRASFISATVSTLYWLNSCKGSSGETKPLEVHPRTRLVAFSNLAFRIRLGLNSTGLHDRLTDLGHFPLLQPDR